MLAWLKLLAPDGPLARAEPKTLRYRILDATARLTHGSRRRILEIQPTWHIVAAWEGISALAQAP